MWFLKNYSGYVVEIFGYLWEKKLEIVENLEEEEVGGRIEVRVVYSGPGASHVVLVVKNPPANAGHTWDTG